MTDRAEVAGKHAGVTEEAPILGNQQISEYHRGFRDGIMQAAEIASNPGFIQGRDTEWDEGVNFAKRFISGAIRRSWE